VWHNTGMREVLAMTSYQILLVQKQAGSAKRRMFVCLCDPSSRLAYEQVVPRLPNPRISDSTRLLAKPAHTKCGTAALAAYTAVLCIQETSRGFLVARIARNFQKSAHTCYCAKTSFSGPWRAEISAEPPRFLVKCI
jgi:hypothetical protein